jgi:hypothetical protein
LPRGHNRARGLGLAFPARTSGPLLEDLEHSGESIPVRRQRSRTQDVARIFSASPVNLALDAPEPVLIGLRRRIRGFPRRHARVTHGLPPFAMCAVFPRSDYYGGSAPRSRRRQTWWLAGARGVSARLGVPVFAALTRGAVGGRLCPWQRGPLPRSRLGSGVPIAGTPRRVQLATGLWLQTRTRRGILPYRGFDHRLRLAWTTVHAALTLAPVVTGLGRDDLCRLFTPLGCCRPPFQSPGTFAAPFFTQLDLGEGDLLRSPVVAAPHGAR